MSVATDSPDGSRYRKTTLKNGLRVVTEKVPSVRSVSLGVWIDVGSRHEQPNEAGISHLIEHMLFKGTKTRSARDIAMALESVGGGLNAFTSREQTCFTARILDEFLGTAVDILSDLTCRATLTPVNLKREKLVICEEIKESVENPSDHVHDLFSQTFWAGQALGRPILGSIESVSGIPRATVTGYIKRHYRAGSIVIAASGAVSHDKLVRLARKYFEFPGGVSDAPESATLPEQRRVCVKATDNGMRQTHLCLGFPGLSYSSKDKATALVLSTYLGGGMSSVLFQRIREDRGLAYSVYTYHESFRDAGTFGIYMATDQSRLAEAYETTIKEVRRLAKRRLKTDRLEQVKAQLKGQIALGMESTNSRMHRLARYELMLGKYVPIEETVREIENVTADRVRELANQLFDEDRIAIAALGTADDAVFGGSL